MADIAQSTLDRLKAKSRSSGRDYQLLLQLFCQEEFLRRLERSDYQKNLILKGGLLLYYVSGFQGRPTQDIDFLIEQLSNTDKVIRTVIENIIAPKRPADFVNFEVRSLEPIAEHRKYHGLRVKMLARIMVSGKRTLLR